MSETVDNITRLKLDGGKEIILVGTAHVSKASAEQVEQLIATEKPDTVCVELCEGRLQKIQDPDSWRNVDLFTIIKRGDLMLLGVNLFLGSFQKKMADKFGIRPGEEMIRAIEGAKEHGAELKVIDRNVRTTLKRTWGYMSMKSKFNFFIDMLGWPTALLMLALPIVFVCKFIWPEVITGKVVMGTFVASMILPFLFAPKGEEEDDGMSEEALEKMKENNMLEVLLQDMGKKTPDIKHRLIDERDLYMVQRIRETAGQKTIAVVGAGHVPGMKEHWQDKIELAELDIIPKPKLSSKILQWMIPLLLCLVFVPLVLEGNWDDVKKEVLNYVLFTGGGAAIGAALALAHPVTILIAFVLAPLTVLHPALGIGLFVALSDCYFRKPRVGDFETVMTDLERIPVGFYKNRILHVLLVTTLSSLGTILGVFIFSSISDIKLL